METPQEIVTIASSDLLAKVQEQKAAGHRLVQICATTLEQLELSYSFMGKEGITHLRLLLPRDQPSLPSITDIYFGAFAYENEMHDLFGIDIRDIRVVQRKVLQDLRARPVQCRLPDPDPETTVMSNRTIIPFGPQHPVLPEPIHLDLVVEDERVIEAIPSFGFIHRGLERLVEKKDFQEFTFVAERVCGICSFIHGMGYCQAVERVMGITLPPRADYLRTFWAELSRIHSHLLWMGLVADAFGFENLFMNSWRIRENILDIVEETTGGWVIFGAAKIGGTRRDVTNDKLKEIGRTLKTIEAELHAITDVFEQDYSVQQRLRGIGILSREDAFDLGAVGPTLREAVNRWMRVVRGTPPIATLRSNRLSSRTVTAMPGAWFAFAKSINPLILSGRCSAGCRMARRKSRSRAIPTVNILPGWNNPAAKFCTT